MNIDEILQIYKTVQDHTDRYFRHAARRRRSVICRVCGYRIQPSSKCVYVLCGDQRKYGCLRCDETGRFRQFIPDSRVTPDVFVRNF